MSASFFPKIYVYKFSVCPEHSFIRSFVHSFVRSFAQWLVCSLIRSIFASYIRSNLILFLKFSCIFYNHVLFSQILKRKYTFFRWGFLATQSRKYSTKASQRIIIYKKRTLPSSCVCVCVVDEERWKKRENSQIQIIATCAQYSSWHFLRVYLQYCATFCMFSPNVRIK